MTAKAEQDKETEAVQAGDSSGSGRGRGGGRGGGAGRGRGKPKQGRGGARKGGEGRSSGSNSGSKLPGANKIKASIRQTKRLLEKPDLNPETKQEAERKLIALEEDLQQKELEDKVARLAVANKKLIFFDSVKAARQIRAPLRSLEKLQTELATAKGKKAKTELQQKIDHTEARIHRFRVMLNYAQHWPPTARYCRFRRTNSGRLRDPTYKGDGEELDDDAFDYEGQDVYDSADEDTDDDEGISSDEEGASLAQPKLSRHLKRAIVHRTWVVEAMKSGEISNEPEKDPSLNLEQSKKRKGKGKHKGKRNDDDDDHDRDYGGGSSKDNEEYTPDVKGKRKATSTPSAANSTSQKHKKPKTSAPPAAPKVKKEQVKKEDASGASGGVEGDDFFDI
ncbi:18S rRNA maturation protein [Tilletia horrida]|uniref:rRNA-processing protein EFG1 n=1 Tax=Tilletia horrida TaxID=155126 RepID=A0AAN6JT65_9BASI|nr:18S rRNA maturation protein [Tilletia horrida]KAK0549337.1 18S rRNA maturation protein [Tilletia horrida]KAK0564469.1 18S rRNA maturation protein [Tilletia horrida]